MSQISFKIPADEMKFLKWYSKKNAQPVSSVYRSVTFETYQKWKTDKLLQEYEKGSISFKQFCELGNVTFSQGTLLLQDRQIEPPISELIDEYTSEIREKLTRKDLFKDEVNQRRESEEIVR